MKKIFTLMTGLFLGMMSLQAQDAGTTQSTPAKTACCSDLKIGVTANIGVGIPDLIRLNTRLRLNGMRPIPSEYVIGTTMLSVQTGRLRYGLEVGSGRRVSEFPQDTLNRVNVTHRIIGLQAGYSVIQNEKYDVSVFGALYDHRMKVEYLPADPSDLTFDEYTSTQRKSMQLNHNIATIRFGAACDYYFTVGSKEGVHLPLTCGLAAHVGTPISRGSWNYESIETVTDPLKVNPMQWNLSARIGIILVNK
jgi:hypothetical protein